MLITCFVIGTLVSLVCWYYLRHKHHTPALHHVHSDLNRHILETQPRFTSPYRMPFWLQNTHLHTLLTYFFSMPKVTFKRENINMKDDGVVALDWVTDNFCILTNSSPVLIVLVTWTTGSKSASGVCKVAMKRGFRLVIFNKRGHGDSMLNTPKLQSLGDSSDFRQCVQYIHKKYPQDSLVGHGSSVGCGTLVSYVVRSGDKCLLTATVYVSPSYNVYRTFTDMRLFYKQILLSFIKIVVWKHRKLLRSVLDLKSVILCFDMKVMDSRMYTKFYGYEDVDNFRKDHDPLKNVESMSIPTLAISSHEDPVCQTSTIPYEMFQDSTYPARMLVTVPKGGHCGFFEGWFRLESWSDKLSLDYLEAVLEFHSAENEG